MRYDALSLRMFMDQDEIEALSFKEVTREELWKAMCEWFYNPTLYYPQGVEMKENEQGHDDKFRYLLQ
jgi:hypothetical protein